MFSDLLTLCEATGDALYVIDDQWRIVALNGPAQQFSSGIELSAIGASLWEIWPTASAPTMVRQLRTAMTERRSVHIEHHERDRAGQDFWLDVRAVPLSAGLGIVVRDLTEHKRAARVLRQVEARLQRVLEATGALVYELDPKHDHIEVAGDTQRIIGYDPQDIPSKDSWWMERLAPGDQARVDAEFWAAVARGDEHNVSQYRIRKRDGSERDVWDRVSFVRDETGRLVQAVGTIVDITERKRHEEQAARLQMLTTALSVALDPEEVAQAIIDQALPALGANAGNVYLIDERAAELVSVAALGYEPAVLEAARRLPLDGPAMMADVVRTGEPITFATWEDRLAHYPHHRHIHAKDGDRAVAGLPLVVEGRAIGALSLAFPIDRPFTEDDRRFMTTVADLCAQALERARLYEAVRRSEAQVRLATDRAPVYLAHCDAEGRYLFVNRGYAERFGLTPEQVIGKRVPEIVGETAYEAFREYVEAVLAGEDVEFEFAFSTPDAGSQLLHVVYAPDRDERGRVRGFLAVITDASERQKAEFRRQFLADASAILGATLDPERTLADVTRIAVPGFADLCVTYLVEDGQPRRVAVAHADPVKAERVLEMQQRYPINLEDPVGLAHVLRSGATEFLPEVTASLINALAQNEEHRALLREIRPLSTITVPLRSTTRVVGAMQFVMTDAGRRFEPEDLWLAEELAHRCATALENSQLYHSLQESEGRFRQLADAMPQIAWVLKADGKSLEYLNKRWFAYTGANPAQGDAVQVNEPIHPDDRALADARWAEAQRAGEPFEAEVRLRAADGSYRWFLSRSVPVRDKSGRIVRWFGTSTDIDDTKRAEATQRFLADLGRTLSATLDPEETLRQVARLVIPALADYCFVDLIGPDEQIRRVAWAHLDPAEQRVFDERLANFVPRRLDETHPISRTLQTGTPQFVPDVTDAWLRDVAFSPKHLEFMRHCGYRSQMTVPLRARGRTLGAITFCFTDISGRRYTPEDLALARDVADRAALAVDNTRLYTESREAAAKVRRLLDAGVIGIIVTGEDRIYEANDHFLSMVGYTREELESGRLNWPEMTPPEYAELDARGLEELRERGVCTPFEKEYIRRDGSRVPILIGAAALEQDPSLWICFILDLTEQKRAEDEWRAFIDATAHDLRNPLTAVLGQTQLLQRRLRRQQQIVAGEGEARLAAIAAASTRAAGLIDDLIDTARLRAGQPLEMHPAPVDLVALVTSCAAEAQRAGRFHRVQIETDGSALMAKVDGPRIERVIRNVLDNAIKYSPAGGDIIVRIHQETDDEGTWAVIAIEDRGIGIPAADVPRVFDRFHRGGNVAGRIAGSGIGLMGAQQIVAQHGGRMGVESTEGVGSIFTLRLPLPSVRR